MVLDRARASHVYVAHPGRSIDSRISHALTLRASSMSLRPRGLHSACQFSIVSFPVLSLEIRANAGAEP